MGVKSWVEKLEAADEAVRSLYKPTEDGKAYILDVESVGGWSLEQGEVLRRNLSKERKRATELANKMAGYGEETPETIGSLKAQIEEMRKNGHTSPTAEIERIKKELTEKESRAGEKYQKTISDKDKEIASLLSEIESQVVTSTATSAIAAKKGIVELLLPHVTKHVKAVKDDKDGRYRARVYDEYGNERLTQKAGSVDPMGVEEFVETLRDRFAPAFEGKNVNGLGAGQGGPSSGAGGKTIAVTRADFETPSRYEALKKQAETTGATLVQAKE